MGHGRFKSTLEPIKAHEPLCEGNAWSFFVSWHYELDGPCSPRAMQINLEVTKASREKENPYNMI
jgi:hypothetical protein